MDIFSQSVEKRLVSDVPIANFLSGGMTLQALLRK